MTIEQNKALNVIESKKEFQHIRDDFSRLLGRMHGNIPDNDAAVRTYNLLCNVESLLITYETLCRQNILAVEVIEDKQSALDYILKLNKEVLRKNV